MNNDRAIAAILTSAVVFVLGLGLWLVWDARSTPPPPPSTPLPVPTAPPADTPGSRIVTPPAAAAGHRLAGTVVGDVTFAIIEDPHGGNALYRPGQAIPGLGELIDITEDHVTVSGSDGSFELRLAAASTATVTPSRAVVETPTAPTREPRRRRDRSTSESSP